jgi:hypothetical protein
MYEELRSTTIHTPTTLSEYGQIANRFPDALNWAGGTYLMSRPGFYPMDSNIEIIDLSAVEELERITRTDRYIQIGAMVNAAQLLDTGRQILPKVLLDALLSIGSTIVRRQMTIGGSLCIPDIRLSIPTALAVLDAMAEVRVYLPNGKCSTRWIPVSRLYDKDGKLTPFEGKFLLTQIRIGLEYGNYQRFLLIGNPGTGRERGRPAGLPGGADRRGVGQGADVHHVPQEGIFHQQGDHRATFRHQPSRLSQDDPHHHWEPQGGAPENLPQSERAATGAGASDVRIHPV